MRSRMTLGGSVNSRKSPLDAMVEASVCVCVCACVRNTLSWRVSVTTSLFATGRFRGESEEEEEEGGGGVGHHSVDFFETCLVCAH